MINKEECIKECIELRRKFTPYKVIHSLLRRKYQCTRSEIRSVLESNGLIKKSTYGGYRPGSGKGDKFIYEDQLLDSYGELIFYLYRKLINDPVRKCYDYLMNGSGEKYYPDFIDSRSNFYEIKSIRTNDFWGHNSRKIKGVEEEINVVLKDELESMERTVLAVYEKSDLMKFKRV